MLNTTSAVNHLGIDVETGSKRRLIERLKRLKTTVTVNDSGAYHQEPAYSQVHLQTVWTEQQLDDWLYKTNGINYVGTFKFEVTSEQ